MTSYDDLNNLKEISFIAGTKKVFNFTPFAENGIDILEIASAKWRLSPYGEFGTVTIEKNAVIPPTNEASPKSLLHFDGTNNSTVFTDETGKIWTGSSYTQNKLTTAKYKFGGASCISPSENTSNISTPSHADFILADNDWTWDFWINFPTGETDNWTYVVGQWGDIGFRIEISNGWAVYCTSTEWQFWCDFSSGDPDYIPNPFAADTWHHIAVVRSGDTPYIFVDGVSQTIIEDTTITGKTLGDIGEPLYVLDTNDWWNVLTPVLIDEIRFSNGIARWTSGFSVPTSEYVTDEYTKILLHLNGTNNSMNIIDESGKTWTVAQDINPSITTGEYKFGTGSLFSPTDTNSYGYISTEDSDDWYLGGDDWTFDYWVRFVDETNYEYFLFGQGIESSTDYFYVSSDLNNVSASCGSADTTVFYFSASYSFSIDTWYHIAIERYGNIPLIFVDGQPQAVSEYESISEKTMADLSSTVQIRGSNSYMDEFRFVKGTAYWTETFVPPTEPYTIPTVVPEIDYFSVTLEASDTVNLSGKYIQQLIVTDSTGKTFIPGQGTVIISPVSEI